MTDIEMREHNRKKNIRFGERYGSGPKKIKDMIKRIKEENAIDEDKDEDKDEDNNILDPFDFEGGDE